MHNDPLDGPCNMRIVGKPKYSSFSGLAYDSMHGLSVDNFVDLQRKTSGQMVCGRENSFQSAPVDHLGGLVSMLVSLLAKLQGRYVMQSLTLMPRVTHSALHTEMRVDGKGLAGPTKIMIPVTNIHTGRSHPSHSKLRYHGLTTVALTASTIMYCHRSLFSLLLSPLDTSAAGRL